MLPHVLTLAVTIGLAAPAAAAEPPMPWSHGLAPVAPRRAGASLAWHGVFGPTVLNFAELHLALPFGNDPKGSFLAGLDVELTVDGLSVPAEQRGDVRVGMLAGELWLTWLGPRRRALHTFGISGGGPPAATQIFWIDPRATSPFFGLFYDGYVETEWVDVSVRTEFSGVVLGGAAPFQGTLHAVAIVKPLPTLAVPVGIVAGHPLAAAQAGVRWRPAPPVELGVDLTFPIWYLGRVGDAVPVQPSLTVKAWDGRPGECAWGPCRKPRVVSPGSTAP